MSGTCWKPTAAWLSREGGHVADVVPYAKGIVTGGTMFTGGQSMAAKPEVVADPAVGGEKLLRMVGVLEALHVSLSSVQMARPIG
jgi:hypothetical protein